MIEISHQEFGPAWMELLTHLRTCEQSSPRGLPVFEELNVVLEIQNSRANILVHSHRRLNYRFMVAEWLWILYGRNDLQTINQYNPNMAQFSDDGQTLAGAYGPHIDGQWNYVVDTLKRDRDSRQAVLTIFTPHPELNKDIPCTLSLQFLIRDDHLHLIVTMRSSDIWLGLPYDVFTFSQLQMLMLIDLLVDPDEPLYPGHLTFHLGSSHLYQRDVARAQNVLISAAPVSTVHSPWLVGGPPRGLETILEEKEFPTSLLSSFRPRSQWRRYAEALIAPTSALALSSLKALNETK